MMHLTPPKPNPPLQFYRFGKWRTMAEIVAIQRGERKP